MKAVVLEKCGGPEELHYQDWELKRLEPDEVLVRVRACGVCYRDILDRSGKFPMIQLPIIPGHEFSGEIVEVGSDVHHFKVGDRVTNLHRAPCGRCRYCQKGDEIHCEEAWPSFGLTIHGSYAEFVMAPAGALVPIPRELSFEKAAPLMCTAAVALRGLRERAHVQKGETVLITGASGGVGSAAVQVAKLLGCRVIAVTTSELKIPFLKQLGTDEVVVSADGIFHKKLLSQIPEGVDVALEIVGSITFNSSLRSLRKGGRLVLIGNVASMRIEINPGYLILNGLTILGSDSATRKDLEQVLEWVASGTLQPQVSVKLPLTEAAKAHRLLESRQTTGRIVLVP
ncbi:MAG: alcohol dehydrogenase catalytic domain-containing protein [Deltaproteobacteria bacterium]|nr:alcohol dehydrogenase catalytic domain-containing protein [Deltaproteobacteria bacterium]